MRKDPQYYQDPLNQGPGEPPWGFWSVVPIMILLVVIWGFVSTHVEAIIAFFKVFFAVLFGIIVLICLVWCIIEIRKIKKVQKQAAQVERERQAALKAAYRRATHAHWAQWPMHEQARQKFMQIVTARGLDHEDVAITKDRVLQLAADIKFCLQAWPHDATLHELLRRVDVLANKVTTYEGARRAFKNRDLTKAWRLVNRLPLPDSDDPGKIIFLQFVYLWGQISREFYTAMVPEFNTGNISLYLLDALGIDIPGQLLYELQSAYHSGRPPSRQLLAQVEHLRGRVLKANNTLPKWGPWLQLLGPQTLAILDRGTEGFILYLLAVALERPFKE